MKVQTVVEQCRNCKGSGKIGKGKSRECPKCKGSGQFSKTVDLTLYNQIRR